jgi:alpha-D-xyloside xylohydrolase
MIKLRYTLRPYILEQMETVAANGTPINRPLSFEFPEDAAVWHTRARPFSVMFNAQ